MLARVTVGRHRRAAALRRADRRLTGAVRPSSGFANRVVIRLRALGALDLRDVNEQELRSVLAQRRRVALLAYLALATPREMHSRDSLVALFWPEYDSEHARNALSQAVHFLRRSLGADVFVSRNGDAVGVNREQVWCDAVAFEELLATGRVADAVDLYRGDLLEGFHISDESEFERWLASERARYADLFAKALERLAEERERASDPAGAVVYWRRLANRAPYNSRLALRLMRALVSAGDPAAAVQHAHIHKTLLREELDIAPDAELDAFLQRIRSGQGTELSIPLSREASSSSVREASGQTRLTDARPAPSSRLRSGRRRLALVSGGLVTAVVAMALILAARNGRASKPQESYLHELYLRGRQAENSRSWAGIQTAKQAYQQALERDSTFALAYAGLAGVYNFIGDYAYAPVGPALDTARMMALRAVQLDSSLSETHIALGITLGNELQFEAAERELRRAIRLDTTSARAHYWYSVLLVALGRAEEALRESTLAARFDPFAPRGVTAMQNYALHLLKRERPWLETREVEQPVLKLEPGEPWARARMATRLAESGRCVQAQSEIVHAQQLAPNDNARMLPFVGTVYWRCGERGRARALLNAMKQRPDIAEHGFRVAILHTLFGENDSAFTWLQHERWTLGELSGLSADPSLDSLRSDERYLVLLQRIGIRNRPQALHEARRAPDSSTAALLRQLYAHGRDAERSRNQAGMQTAMAYYRQAIERDSGFALAYAALSEAYALTAHYDFAAKAPALDSARIMAARAMEIDPRLPESHIALAVSLGNDRRFEEAEQEFQRAIRINVNNPDAHYWYAMLLVSLGRGADALAEADSALADRFAPRAALATRRDALFLLTGKHNELKLPVRERRPIGKVETGEPWVHARDASELAEEGRCDEARSEIQQARQLVPDSDMVMLAYVGATYWSCRERDYARSLLTQMKRRSDAREHGLRVALLHTQFGEYDSAFVWLGQHRWMISELPMLRGDRMLDPLRSDQRFVRLLQRIGVPENTPAKGGATDR